MSISARIALIVMLVSCGLWAGVILTFAIERVNLWARMSVPQYVVDFRRSLYRVDPLQPILAVVAVIAAIVFALSAGGVAAALTWMGAALIIGVVVTSIALPEQINSKFRRRAEGEAPDDAENLRTRWRTLHYIRTGPAIAAFVVLTLAVACV